MNWWGIIIALLSGFVGTVVGAWISSKATIKVSKQTSDIEINKIKIDYLITKRDNLQKVIKNLPNEYIPMASNGIIQNFDVLKSYFVGSDSYAQMEKDVDDIRGNRRFSTDDITRMVFGRMKAYLVEQLEVTTKELEQLMGLRK